MTVSITNATLSAFGFSAMLSLALAAPVSIVPGGMLSGVGVAPQAPATATTEQPPVITVAQLTKLQKVLDDHGKATHIEPDLSAALNLNTTSLLVIAARDDNQIHHVYGRLPDGGFFLGVVDNKTAKNYRLDSNFKLTSAVIMIDNKASGTPPDASHMAQTELTFWAKMADTV